MTQSVFMTAALMLGVSVGALAAAPAGAQTAAPQPAPPPPAANSNQLGEVIVTAQRREQRLQDVPIAVTFANAQTLDEAHVENVNNIQALSPSIHFTTSYNASSSSNIQIRGIGTVGQSRSFEGAVGVFIDGVYRTRSGEALENFLDIDNLQVLRGPQGTLFGKNTSAGAILVTSVKPMLGEFGGNVEGQYGDYNYGLVRGAVNIPLGDKAALRLAGDISTRSGYLTDPNTGKSNNDYRSGAVKAQLLFEPTNTVEFRLIGDYSREHDNCCFGSVNVNPGPVQPLVNALIMARGLTPPSTNLDDYQSSISQPTDQLIQDRGVVLHANWKTPLGGQLHYITAYRDWSLSHENGDADFSAMNLINIDETFESKFFSQELTYTGNIGNRADFVVGAYYSHEDIHATQSGIFGDQAQTYLDDLLFAADGLPPGTVSAAPGTYETDDMRGINRSLAAYTHWTVNLTGKLKLIAGLRFTDEEKTGDYTNVYFRPTPNEAFLVLGVLPGPDYDRSITNDAFSGTAGLQYDFTPGAMAYATYSRGFKAGGVNLDPNAAGAVANNPAIVPGAKPQDPAFLPEFINGYEAGVKLNYLDHRAQTNITAFYDGITDIQIAQYLGLQFKIFNAPSAEVYGLELENSYRATDWLTLHADGTYLPHAKYGDSTDLGPPLSGRRFSDAPTFAGNVSANLDHPVTDDLDLTGRAAYQYQGTVFTNTVSDTKQGAYGLLALSGGLKSNHHGWSAEFWCQNCTDKHYVVLNFQAPVQAGTEGAYVGAPRTFGMTVRKSF